MTPEELKILQDSVADAIRLTVNGKIDSLNEKLDQHIVEHKADAEEIKSFLELKRGALVLGHLGKWLKDMTVYVFIGWELLKITIKQ